MKALTPNLFVQDLPATIAWYRNLGFEVVNRVPEEGDDLVWAMLTNGGVSLMLQTFASLGSELPAISREDGGSLLLYVEVEDIQALHDQVAGKVEVIKPLETTFYGATEFTVLDPNRYVLTFAEMSR